MLSSILFHLILAVNYSSSMPLQRRALSQNDIIGLQLASYLENLELSLYAGGCTGFTQVQWIAAGFPSTFHQDICSIAEVRLPAVKASHYALAQCSRRKSGLDLDHRFADMALQQQQNQTDLIASTLESNGITAPQACTYSLSYDTPSSFVLLANQITSISLGFYLGSLNEFSPELQTVAASILSVEARHDAIVRNGMGASPFPTNLDVPLSSVWAYNLAQKYITSCPQQLPINPLPPLNFNGASDRTLNFGWSRNANNYSAPVETGRPLYLAMIHSNVSDAIYQQVQTKGQGQGTVQLPEGLGGVVYAALTGSSGDLTYDELTTTGTLAGPAQLVLS